MPANELAVKTPVRFAAETTAAEHFAEPSILLGPIVYSEYVLNICKYDAFRLLKGLNHLLSLFQDHSQVVFLQLNQRNKRRRLACESLESLLRRGAPCDCQLSQGDAVWHLLKRWRRKSRVGW
jgi:hypothetical protein